VGAQQTELQILADVPPFRRGEISRRLAALNANVCLLRVRRKPPQSSEKAMYFKIAFCNGGLGHSIESW
jgi:hypothetical protein